MCKLVCSPDGARGRRSEEQGRREGALDRRLDGRPELREEVGVERALLRGGEACESRAEAVCLGVVVRGVGLDAHEYSGGVEGVHDSGEVVGVGVCDEVSDASRGGLVGACEREGLEERGESLRGRLIVPVGDGAGHVGRDDGEDVEQALFSPCREENAGEVSEGGGGGRAETQEGVGGVELVLREVRVGCEDGLHVVRGDIPVEERELSRELECVLALEVGRELVEARGRLGGGGCACVAEPEEIEDACEAGSRWIRVGRDSGCWLGEMHEPFQGVRDGDERLRRVGVVVAYLGQEPALLGEVVERGLWARHGGISVWILVCGMCVLFVSTRREDESPTRSSLTSSFPPEQVPAPGGWSWILAGEAAVSAHFEPLGCSSSAWMAGHVATWR